MLQTTRLTRRSSGRAKAGFASFVPPLKSNVRLLRTMNLTTVEADRIGARVRPLFEELLALYDFCLLYTSPSPRDS